MIAHINEYGDEQTIKEHLEGTAERAETFAEEFGCGEIGNFCGLLHDIGKYSKQFQERIRDPEHVGKVDHSTAGAVEAIAMSKENIPLAMIIAGHHSGLLDGGSDKISRESDGTFFGRLKGKNRLPDYQEWKKDIVPKVVKLPEFCTGGKNPLFTMSFFIRILYSCLVDADYLDTEYFMNRGDVSRGNYISVEALLARFEGYIEKWTKKQDFSSEKQEQLCRNRNEILYSCMEKGARFERGLYTLTVPTGGGKTTASLGFALKHMNERNMKRVIYVIPYTSVIDQNAAVFSEILGKENVLEHHSGVLYEMSESQAQNDLSYRKVLATENWDAPVVVTTAVQFFESLFANKSSKCRKLHNIANSVIIFDEAQTLPIPYLEPCIAAVSELVAHYRSTVILCTATQPALDTYFKTYLPDREIKEICDNVMVLSEQFRRTTIKNIDVLDKCELQDRLADKQQVLCIVNKRKTAQELFHEIPEEGKYCLTTLLCPAHRKAKFEEIKQRLKNGLPCRVIATSLVEAGVDLDFPEVYRQEAGLDSLIQSAGRCNREGKRKAEESNVFLFRLEGETPEYIRQSIDALQETLRHYDNPATLDAIKFYFQFYRELLGRENLDQKKIMDAFTKGADGKIFPFDVVSKRFKLIENETKTVYIPMDEAKVWIDELYHGRPTRELFRKLGQYSVNVYPNHFSELMEAGCLEVIDDTIYVLRDMNQYKEDTGLQMDVETGFGILV